MNKYLGMLVALIVGVSLYSYQLLIDDTAYSQNNEDQLTSSSHDTKESKFDGNDNEAKRESNKASQLEVSQSLTDTLPFDVTLRGLVYSKIATQSYVQIENEKRIGAFYLDEQIFDTQVYVKRINRASVVVQFNAIEYELILTGRNSLEEPQERLRFAQMSAKEIGSRPRTIEHVVRLLPNLFNDGGKLVIPGQNPSLFSAARFKEGDVLLEVNGFNIDDESSFDALQQQIRGAQTLKFIVNRAGRRVTLYLDIPSEALKL